MNCTIPCTRRRALYLMVGALGLPFATTTAARSADPIRIDGGAIQNLGDLVTTIRSEAKRRGVVLPESEVLRGVARAFVDHAEGMADQLGEQIPDWLRRGLSQRFNRRMALIPDQNDALVAIAVLGLVFLLPKLVLLVAVVGSLTVIASYLLEALGRTEAPPAITT